MITAARLGSNPI